MTETMREMLKTRDEYIDLIRRELLGPGSEISLPDEEHELISSDPYNRYSLGILFPRDWKMETKNDNAAREGESEAEAGNGCGDTRSDSDKQEEYLAIEPDPGEEDDGCGDTRSDSDKREEHAAIEPDPGEENGMDEEISLSAQNMPSCAGLTFLAKGNTDHVTCRIRFGTYHNAQPEECRMPFSVEHPERVRVPRSLCEYVRYDTEEQCFRLIRRGLTSRMITDSKRSDPAPAKDGYDVYNALYGLSDQLAKGYVRDPHEAVVVLDFTSGDYCDGTDEGIDGIPVRVSGLRRRWHDDIWSVTVMLVNDTRDSLRGRERIPGFDRWRVHPAIFQPEIFIQTEGNDFIFQPFSNAEDLSTMDEEEMSLELQYRNRKNYANGVGTAAGWEVDEAGRGFVHTDFYPAWEMPRMDFGIPADSQIDSNALSMKYLSDMDKTPRSEKLQKLRTIVSAYRNWAAEKRKQAESVASGLKEAASRNIDACEAACARVEAGIDTLANHDDAWNAFQLANRAMFMQRVHLKLQEETANVERFPDDSELAKLLNQIEDDGYETADQKIHDKYAWRLFQIAFLLMSVDSIATQGHPDRELVDLIWFPTGGGKTEAYLGLTAFAIFFRRLRFGEEQGGGTTVIMRYTLRLLTAQQFTRASTLICACEFIRADATSRRPRYGRYPLGKERITIGLWIGSDHTPNRNTGEGSAKDCINKLNHATTESELWNKKERFNKFQVLKCPWCGTKLVKEVRNGKLVGQWGYAMANNAHFELRCPTEACFFNSEGSLPVQVVDEELYRCPPSLLFGTVDKFAMLPWHPEIGKFFGIGAKSRAPELIIQDELHLISGPLGTMVGLYETAIDALCREKGGATKIIASTATIRRAKEQCAALYDRRVAQFPPPGIDAEDSFFSREERIDHENGNFGRLYIGLMASGKTKARMEAQTIAALMQRIHMMDLDDEVKDKYWTLTGYFNSLKELGKCSILVEDDVKDAIRTMATRLGGRSKSRLLSTADELTSRVSTTQLNETLDKLEKLAYSAGNRENRHYASDIVLATNMISVGIDVPRLNVMLMVGQPKLTSEYIQASSRVGRQYPGVVFTMYDGVRSRDRSHYEQFHAYHEACYRFVEPTGATPFSGPARERALHAVVIGLLRILEERLRDEKSVANFDKEVYKDRIEALREQILARSRDIMAKISPDADDEGTLIADEIDGILRRWQNFAKDDGKDALYYGERFLAKDPKKGEKRLLRMFGKKAVRDEGAFDTMTSMRSVDSTVKGNVRIWED